MVFLLPMLSGILLISFRYIAAQSPSKLAEISIYLTLIKILFICHIDWPIQKCVAFTDPHIQRWQSMEGSEPMYVECIDNGRFLLFETDYIDLRISVENTWIVDVRNIHSHANFHSLFEKLTYDRRYLRLTAKSVTSSYFENSVPSVDC